LFIAVAEVLIPLQVFLAVPVPAQAQQVAAPAELAALPELSGEALLEALATPPPAAPVVQVNKNASKVQPPDPYPKFSGSPTDQEIFAARVFGEPLVPMGGAEDIEENRALASAITAYLRGNNTEDLSRFERFLQSYPDSRWKASLLTNMGVWYRRIAYYTRAQRALEEAWSLSKNAEERNLRATADLALAQLLDLHMMFGHLEELDALLGQVGEREILGGASEKVQEARGTAWGLRYDHERAIPSGPVAVGKLLELTRGVKRDPEVEKFHATPEGASLTQMKELSERVGLNLQMAHREAGSEVVVPSVVHLRAGHFAAVVEKRGNHFLLNDPLLGGEVWMSRKALEEETSGYFLILPGSLPAGWRATPAGEGDGVRGKCVYATPFVNHTRRCDKLGGGCGTSCARGGMAEYSFHLLRASIHITDTPVGYSPPRGPAVRFEVTYNQREATQPQTFYFSNLGTRWTFDWISFVEDNPSNPGGQPVDVYLRGGGRETYSAFVGGSSAPETDSRAVVVLISSSPIKYERRLADGSVEVFAQPDGATTSPRRVFMTEWKDPQGNKLSFAYDSQFRLVSVTDALNQVTTLSYEQQNDPLKITKVTDPFGRYATFEYNAGGQLVKITDVIGLTSEFEYGASDFIRALTTPYGTTSFSHGTAGNPNDVWLEAVDPLGGKERVQFYLTSLPIAASEPAAQVPVGFANNDNLNTHSSVYWDKRAMALYPGDATKGRIIRWLSKDTYKISGMQVHSEKLPLENRVWYGQVGETIAHGVGPDGRPAKIGRVLDDGSSQIYRYEYNPKGNVIRATDPVGRETVSVYGTGSTPDPDPATGTGIDLLEVKQKNGSAYDKLASLTYNAQHRPLTTADTAAQTTTFTYNAQGQLLTVTTPPRAGITENRTTTYAYDANGYLQSVTGPATGATTSYTYDAYGRVRTVTDPDSYTLTFDYDALDRETRVTLPDGTYQETIYNRLDPEKHRDRLGRWSHTAYDALRRVVATRDPLGRTVTNQWCTCGSLDKLSDPNGNPTTWERDVQGRVTKEIRANGAETLYVYENTTSRLKRITDPKGQHEDYSYFRDSNLQQMSYPNPQFATSNVTFTYDPNFDLVTTMADGAGTTTYAYHPIGGTPPLGAGRLASVDGPLSNDTVSYAYDELGRVVSRSINGVTATWTYDALGRVSGDTNPLGSFTYGYDGTTGRLLSMTYPNGQSTNYAYYPNSGDHRLQEIHHRRSGGATLSKFNYSYDVVGNIKVWTQQTDSNPAKAYDLGYDAADDLTAATWRTIDPTPVILKRHVYSYDLAANRTTEQIDDSATGATYDNMNRVVSQQPGGALRFKGTLNEAATVTVQTKPAQVSSDNKFEGPAQVTNGTTDIEVKAKDYSGNERTNTYRVNASGSTKTFTYDANGSLTGDGTRTFEWDGRDRLVAVNQGVLRSEFSYDGAGRRIRIVEKNNGVVTSDRRFVWCGRQMCEERDASGSVVQKRFFDNGMQEGAATYFFAADHLGSVREMTDSSGAVRARYEYDAFGRTTKVAGDKESPFTFSGHYAHLPTALALAFYRAYDASLGRWINEDPIGFGDGWNLYHYVWNNPALLNDPFGLQTQPGQKKQPPFPPPDVKGPEEVKKLPPHWKDPSQMQPVWRKEICGPSMVLVFFRDDGPNAYTDKAKWEQWRDQSRKECEGSAPPGKTHTGVTTVVPNHGGWFFVYACCEHDKVRDDLACGG
jgi:RHS repeat-associated protein